MRRAVLNAGDLLEAGYRKGGFRRKGVLITLTYRGVDDWRNRHVSVCIQRMKEWAARKGVDLGYVWTAELQARGAVHYHIVCWLPPGLMMPKPDKQGWWKHGSTRIERARKPVGYLVKYASKGDDIEAFPKGLRLHGRGGLSLPQRREVAWWLLPRYVRAVFSEVGTIVRRAKSAEGSGGWCDTLTGQWMPSWRPPAFTEATVGAG